MNFPHYPLFQAKPLFFPKPGKKILLHVLEAHLINPVIRYLWSLLPVLDMNCHSQTQEDKKNHSSSFFINQLILIFKSFLLGYSVGLLVMMIGPWDSIWRLPRILLSRHTILLWRLTASSGCAKENHTASSLCLHDLQICLFFLSTPTLIQRNLLLVGGGVSISSSYIFFPKLLCFSLHFPFFLSFTSPKCMSYRIPPKAMLNRGVCALKEKKGKRHNMGII